MAEKTTGKHAAKPVSTADSTGAFDAPASETSLDAEVSHRKRIKGHKQRSRRTRIVLIFIILLLLAGLGFLGYTAWNIVMEANQEASQTAASHGESSTIEGDTKSDAGTTDKVKPQVSIPNLANLVGLTTDEAISYLGSGAEVSSTTDITEEVEKTREVEVEVKSDDPKAEPTTEVQTETYTEEEVVGHHVTISMKNDKTDSQGNRPSVYLTTDKDEKTTIVGYSISMESLGYGDMSFNDAVNVAKIVQNTLSNVGVTPADGNIALPEDESEYRTFGEDGTTVAEESYTFKGDGTTGEGTAITWSLRLTYDYSAYNVSKNWDDVIKLVYVTVEATE